MSDARGVTPEELLAETRRVRALARSLATDPSTADDIAQETWLAALRHAPKSLVSPRAWLGHVLVNIARRNARRGVLRVERERGAARPEALPSTAQIAARAEMQRTLVAAVLALAEPYRSTILWRYFEDLSSEEIARRLGVSSSTVRNRLKRGLDLLRTELERHDASNWHDHCLALAVFGFGVRETSAAATSSWAAKGVVMGTKIKVALGLTAVLVASVALWHEFGSERRDGSSSADTRLLARSNDEARNARTPPIQHEALASSSTERTPLVDGSTPNAVQVGAAFLFGDVRCPAGESTPKGRIQLVDEWGERADAPIVRGSYAIPALHAGDWKLRVRECTGFFAPELDVVLKAGASTRADVDLAASQRVAIRLTTNTGESVESFFRDDSYRGVYLPEIEVIATREPLSSDVSEFELARLRCGTYTPASKAGQPGNPQVHKFSGTLELDTSPPAYASAILRGHVLTRASIDPSTLELTLLVDVDRMTSSLGKLRLRVLAAHTGEPIAQAGISLSDRPTSAWANPFMIQLDDGVFERERLPRGTYEMQIRLPGFEHVVRTVKIEAGRTTDLGDVRVELGSVLRGRVVDETGKGISAQLGWSSTDDIDGPTFIDGTRSESDGAFALAELPAHGVLVRISDSDWALDPIAVRARSGEIDELTLTARRGTPVTLRQRLGGDVKVALRNANGDAIWTANALGASTHRLRLLPGSYTFEARSNDEQKRSRALVVADTTVEIQLEP